MKWIFNDWLCTSDSPFILKVKGQLQAFENHFENHFQKPETDFSPVNNLTGY